MADERDNIRKEFRSIAEETAAVFSETLTSISSNFARQLREQAGELDELGKSLLRNFKNDLASLSRSASGLLNVQDKLRNGVLQQKDITREIQQIQFKINKVLIDRQNLLKVNGQLTAQQERDFENALSISQEQVNQLRSQGEILSNIDDSLDGIGSGFKLIDGVLQRIGINSPFKEILTNTKAARGQLALNKEELKSINDLGVKATDYDKRRAKQLEAENKILKNQSQLRTQIGVSLKNTLSPSNILFATGLKVLESVFKLNKAQTDFRRLTGESATEVGLLNDGLLTSVDLIQTQIALTQQFGLNARVAFGTQTLQEVGELTKAVGLTAEEAGNLARFAEIGGTNLNTQLDALSKSVPKAFSQKQILSETANVSSDIALAFGNSAYEIGQSVIAAKQLGLTLKDINGIADSLLNIEESLTAEFTAEVITGKQINFERARMFALTNDIAGLTQEIKNNEELITDFANANRIEQEAIAGSIGMSRQQMADMVMQSKLINTLTESQRANAAGVSIEQLKQLDIQQSIETSINKITQALAGPIEGFAQLIQFATKYANIIAGVLAATTAMKAVNSAIVAQQKIKNNLSKKEALIEAAKASISALKNPFALAAGIVAGGVAFAAASKYIQKAGDAIIPATGGPLISTREGGLIQGTKNDDIVMAPGIARGGRNSGEIILSDAQISRIANAVREGASRATINLDGDRVSNRLQPSLAVNTRKYSV